jgi:CcmD family protein
MERDLLFIFYAFGAVWAIVAAYVIHLGLRESKVRRQLENVKKMVEAREKS